MVRRIQSLFFRIKKLCIYFIYSHTTHHKMGQSQSTVIGEIVIDGKRSTVYENQRKKIEKALKDNVLSMQQGPGFVPAGHIGDSVVYYNEGSKIVVEVLERDKSELIRRIAEILKSKVNEKIAIGIATQIANYAIPVAGRIGVAALGTAMVLVPGPQQALLASIAAPVTAIAAIIQGFIEERNKEIIDKLRASQGLESIGHMDNIEAVNPMSQEVVGVAKGYVDVPESKAGKYINKAAAVFGIDGRGETGDLPPFFAHDFVVGGAYTDELRRIGGNNGTYVGIDAGIDATDADALADISKYSDSTNAKTKDALIDTILRVLDNLGLKAEGKTRMEKIMNIIKVIPSGDKIKSDEGSQKRVCFKIAEAINDIHGSRIIDSSLPAEVVCRQVVEIISSLTAGMHTEFLSIYNEAKRIVNNLHILDSATDENLQQLKDKISATEDRELVDNLALNYDLFKMLSDEKERQLTMMKGVLNMDLAPTERDLADLLKKKKNLYKYVESVEYKPGKGEFGKVIEAVLKGLGLTAAYAEIINNALKKVGMTIEEYASEKNLGDFQKRITEKVSGNKLTEQDLHDFLSAADLLYKNFYRNTDIATFIKSRQGMYENKIGGATRYPKSIVDKRVADKRKLRNLIFNAFYRSVSEIFSNMVGSLNIISKKIGTEIPLSDQLDEFRHIIQRMRDQLVENRNIYYALIGYYNDALSKEKRETLLGELRMISSYVDSILEMDLYKSSSQYFRDFQTAIKSLIDLIAKYSDEMAAKFGRGEGDEDVVVAPGVNVMREGDCKWISREDNIDEPEDDSIHGNYDGVDSEGVFGNAELFSEPVQIKRSSKSIYDAFRQFDYYYRVAQIRANLASTAGELKHYGGEKYERLVASSVANILQESKDKYDVLRGFLERIDKTAIPATAALPTASFDDERQRAIEFMDKQWEAKKKFWATMEAVDTYMRVFTDGLVNNPSDIRDIKSMLDDIEVINDTYNNATGERLANVFEHFPNVPLKSNVKVDDAVPLHNTGSGASHYYDKIKDKNGELGNPRYVTTPSHALMARNQIKAMITGMGMLKNFMSVFIYIGSKFGGNELRNKVFMTPTQIYNNIVEYIQASAFSQGVTSNANNNDKISRDGSGKYVVPNDYVTGTTTADGIDLVTIPGASINFIARFGAIMRTIDKSEDVKEVMSFGKEDEYFVMLMKALAAKIFTVTGMYDVLDRPHEINSISPIRMIIGGLDMPKVEEGAVELYLRLPLLAQFYRDLFNFDGENDYNPDLTGIPREGNTHLKISMVPEVEGVFSGLVNLVFKRTKNVYETAYTDEEMKELVSEINIIYQRMLAKHGQNVVMSTIREFMDEINRRYAIVSKKDHDTYVKEFGYDYSYSQDNSGQKEYNRYADPIDTDIAILPGEGTDEIARKSPAERLLSMKFDTKDPLGKHTMDDGYYKLLYRFRCCIDKMFEEAGSNEEYTFKNAIKIAQAKLKKEQKDDDRFKIVSSLVRGVDVYTKVDGFKYLLFHETVVTGLNTLSAFHSILQRFHDMSLILDLRGHQEAILEWLKAPGAGVKQPSAILNAVEEKIKGQVQMPYADLSNMIPELLFGKSEASIAEGGFSASDYAIKRVNGVTEDVTKSRGGVYSLPYAGNCNDKFYQRNRLRSQDVLLSTDPNILTEPSTNKAGGLVEILAGFSVRDLEEALCADNDSDAKAAIQTFFRFLFSRENVMSTLFETVFGVTNDLQGLVDVRIDEGRLHFNLGGIKKYLEEMFGHVSYFINALRPFVRQDLMDRYTSKINPGSYYWLHEQIMEKLIIGRPAQLKTDDIVDPKRQYINLEECGRKLSHCYEILTLQYLSDGSGLHALTPSTFKRTSANSTSYDKVFSKLIFYNSALPGSGLLVSNEANSVAASGEAISAPVIADFRSNPFEQLHISQVGGSKIVDTRYIARFKQLYSWGDEFTLNRSAMYVFNQLVAKFIKQFYDPATQKIYINVINSFANGVFNQSVIDQMYTYPDIAPALFVKFGKDDTHKISSLPFIRNKAPSISDNLVDVVVDALNKAKGPTNALDAAGGPYVLPPIELKYRSDNNRAIVNIGGVGNGINQFTLHVLLQLLGRLYEKLYKYANNGTYPVATALNAIGNTKDELVNSILQVLLTAVAPVAGTDVATALATRPAAIDAASYIASVRVTDVSNIVTNILLLDDLTGGAAPISAIYFNQIDTKLPGMIAAEEIVTISYIFSPGAWNIIESLRIFSPDEQAPPISSADSIVTEAVLILYGLDQAPDGAALAALMSEFYKVHSYYKPRDKTEPTYAMKLDDSFSVVTEAYINKSVLSDGGGSGFIRLARSGTDDILPPDSYKNLDINPIPPASATVKIDDVVKYGRRMDPDGMHVLFTSLSVILKNLVTSRNATNQQSVYLTEAVSDVPLYMKERYRGEMPLFKMLFKDLIARCDLNRRFISRPEVSLERRWAMCVDGAPKVNPWPYVLLNAEIDSKTAKTRFNGILDSITKGCTSLVSACDQVTREVGDDAKYMETYSGSIRDYKNQYGVEPFMPLSNVLTIFRNKSRDNYLDNLPFYVLGQDQFKFQFGTRMLLAQPQTVPTMEHVPGYAQIIESYNSLLDTRSHVDSKHAEDFMKALVRGLRFIFELKHIKSSLVPVHYKLNLEFVGGFSKRAYKPTIYSDDLVVDIYRKNGDGTRDTRVNAGRDDANNNLYFNVTNNPFLPITLFDFGENDLNADSDDWPSRRLLPVYSLTHDLSTIVSMAESSLRDDKIREIVEYISQTQKKKGSLAIKNIIDLNIIPINVHALMREIPLANVFNYAYTFDRLIIELYYGLNNVNAAKLIKELCYDVWGNEGPLSSIKDIYSVKDMLVSLLIRPYMKVDESQKMLVDGMFRGAGGNELGRPKFLSDQLYNKALIGELYASRRDYSEHGPANSQIAFPIVSNNEKIQICTEAAYRIIRHMYVNDAAVFGALLITTPYAGSLLLKFVSDLVKYINDNPRKSLDDILLNNEDRALKAGTGVDKFIDKVRSPVPANAGNPIAEQYELFNIAVSTVCKFVSNIYDSQKGKNISGLVDNLIETLKNGVLPGAADASVRSFVNENKLIEILNIVNISNPAGALSGITNVILDRFKTNAGDSLDGSATLHYLDTVKSSESDKYGAVIEPDNENVVDSHQIHEVDLAGGSATLNKLKVLASTRFDTIYARNLIFIVNLYRSVRLKLQRDLVYDRETVVRSAAVTRPDLTEFYGNRVDTPKRSYSRNEYSGVGSSYIHRAERYNY